MTRSDRDLVISGNPASVLLRDSPAISRQIAQHLVRHVAPCRALAGDLIDAEIVAVTGICLDIAVAMLDGADRPPSSGRLELAAAMWAREGVPIEAVHRAVNVGLGIAFDLIAVRATVDDYSALLEVARRFVDISDHLTAAVGVAFMRELRTVVDRRHAARRTLASALLSGHRASPVARECGVTIAAAYYVMALAISPRGGRDKNDVADPPPAARRALERIGTELDGHRDDQVLALLGIHGGAVLIPVGHPAGGDLNAFISRLSRAGRVSIRAAVVESPAADIPEATRRAHDLLDIVDRLELIDGIYHFGDLAVEYQLTRPGPALERLGAILDPLDEYPELMETLRVHISNNLIRQRTARKLQVHVNTVDYRCRRIGRITGFDPSEANGQWYLRSALIARTYRKSVIDFPTSASVRGAP
ncbi:MULTISPECIES: PucR family transcriptional regulator [Nocardia]|uniref:PucR family transcriptional regulator n=1 Tax=Nocardia TaxID=1817 RepID=UPI000D694F37|nr:MULTISPECIES: helix-turn-helix domain-containing protein [Nocardia]